MPYKAEASDHLHPADNAADLPTSLAKPVSQLDAPVAAIIALIATSHPKTSQIIS
jgi:hypothetical protein